MRLLSFTRFRFSLGASFALALLPACPKRLPPPPPAIIGARLAYEAAKGDPEKLLLALERYQVAAAAAPQGSYAPEAAYVLGIIALDLDLYGLPVFDAIPGFRARLAKKLAQRGIPPTALHQFALRVFGIARDGWTGSDRDRAERAIELTGHRERLASMLSDIANNKNDGALKRFATLVALAENEERFLRSVSHRELVERTSLAQRAMIITLLGFIDEKEGCAVLAFLAKMLLGKTIEAESPLQLCWKALGDDPTKTLARLTRAAWVRLEEFALDRPNSPIGPIAQRLLSVAPAAAKAPPGN